MILTVLGSGSSTPLANRRSSGYWLQTSAGTIALDISASAVHSMAEFGLDWANLSAIWISHFHLDHFGGLLPFLFGTKYAFETQKRKSKLSIFGPPGITRLIGDLDSAGNFRLLEQPFPIEIIEVTVEEKFEILPKVEAVSFSTPHTEESCAIRIEDSGSSLVYTADTGFETALASFAKRSGLFITEASFLKNKPVELHLELAEAMYLFLKAEPVEAMLTHFYPEWNDVDFDEEVARFSPAQKIYQATDGLQIAIKKTP